jgi:hypothetical protein
MLNYNAIRRIARDIHHDAQEVTNMAYGDPAIIHSLFERFATPGATVNEYDMERKRFYEAHIHSTPDALQNTVHSTLDALLNTVPKECPDAV